MTLSDPIKSRSHSSRHDSICRVEEIVPCRLPPWCQANLAPAQSILRLNYEFYDFSQVFADNIGLAVGVGGSVSDDVWLAKAASKFKGQIVVDLGAGSWANGFRVSAAVGAKAYIGVEPYNFRQLFIDLENHQSPKITMPSALVPEDMLTALQALPPDSVSILLSGMTPAYLENLNTAKKWGGKSSVPFIRRVYVYNITVVIQ